MRSSEADRVEDPWAVTPAGDDPSRVRRDRWTPVAVVALASVGPAVRLWRIDAPGHRTAAVGVVAAVTAVEVVLRAATAPRRSRRSVFVAGAAAAIAAVATLLAAPTVGRAPMLLAVAVAVVAHAAADRVATLALAPLAIAQVWWIRGTSNATAAILVAAAVAVVAVYLRRPDRMAPVDARVRRGVGAVAAAVSSLVMLVVATPTLYLAGAVGHLLRRLVPAARPRRGWVDRSSDAARVVDDAARPYSTAPPAVRWPRNAAGLAVLAAVVAITLVTVDARRGEPPPRRVATRAADRQAAADPFEQIDRTPYSERPGYASMPFADAMQRELLSIRLQPDPVTGYRNGDLAGRYVNVVDGSRATRRPACDCPRVSVWFGGASTAFGVGQRDDHTVASELVRLAERDSVALDVRNLGVPGWTVWQEARDFGERLTAATDPPDVAVFLDGFNDALGTITQSVVAGRIDDGPTVMDNADVLAATRDRLEASSVGGGRVLGREAARRYRVEMAAIAEHARARSVETVHYFQPDAFASARQSAAVEGIYAFDPDLFERAEAAEALEAMSTALEADVHNLRHALDGARRPMFGDAVHLNEEGASLLAREMYRTLGPAVRRLAATR